MAFDKVTFLANAQKKLDDAEALMSDADRDEAAARDEGEAKADRAKSKARDARELSLKRRLETAESEHPGVKLKALSIQEFDDTFIIQRDGPAHARFEKLLAESSSNKKIDLLQIKRDYAIGVTIDWNGKTDFADTSMVPHDLRAFFEQNPAVVTPIINAALALNGAFAEERKS